MKFGLNFGLHKGSGESYNYPPFTGELNDITQLVPYGTATYDPATGEMVATDAFSGVAYIGRWTEPEGKKIWTFVEYSNPGIAEYYANYITDIDSSDNSTEIRKHTSMFTAPEDTTDTVESAVYVNKFIGDPGIGNRDFVTGDQTLTILQFRVFLTDIVYLDEEVVEYNNEEVCIEWQ